MTVVAVRCPPNAACVECRLLLPTVHAEYDDNRYSFIKLEVFAFDIFSQLGGVISPSLEIEGPPKHLAILMCPSPHLPRTTATTNLTVQPNRSGLSALKAMPGYVACTPGHKLLEGIIYEARAMFAE